MDSNKLNEVMTFHEATTKLNRTSSYLNNLIARGELKEGVHYRKAGRVKLILASVVNEMKPRE